MSDVFAVDQKLGNVLTTNVKDNVGWVLRDDSNLTLSRCYYVTFASITRYLAKVKDANQSVGLIVRDRDGNMAFGAIVEFHEGIEGQPGNWSYEFTFDPADINSCGKVYSTDSNDFKETAIDIGIHEYGFEFQYDESTDNYMDDSRVIITNILTNTAAAVREWVEENSISTNVEVTNIEGMVVIEAAVDESGMKVFSITPSGELKNIIKDDSALEGRIKD